MTIKTAIEGFIAHLKLANKSPHTVRCYGGNLMAFARVAGDVQASALRPCHIESYFASMDGRKNAKSTRTSRAHGREDVLSLAGR